MSWVLALLKYAGDVKLQLLDGVWQLAGKPKAVAWLNKRAAVFYEHLRTKHPEWRAGSIGEGIVAFPQETGASLLAIVYALRCAATHAKCPHKA